MKNYKKKSFRIVLITAARCCHFHFIFYFYFIYTQFRMYRWRATTAAGNRLRPFDMCCIFLFRLHTIFPHYASTTIRYINFYINSIANSRFYSDTKGCLFSLTRRRLVTAIKHCPSSAAVVSSWSICLISSLLSARLKLIDKKRIENFHNNFSSFNRQVARLAVADKTRVVE